MTFIYDDKPLTMNLFLIPLLLFLPSFISLYLPPLICPLFLIISGLVRNLLPRAAMGLSVPLLAPLWSASFSFR